MCKGPWVGKENGPLEELQLKVSDGEKGVRWGCGGKLGPDSKDLAGGPKEGI